MKKPKHVCPVCAEPYPVWKLILCRINRLVCPSCRARLGFSLKANQRIGAVAVPCVWFHFRSFTVYSSVICLVLVAVIASFSDRLLFYWRSNCCAHWPVSAFQETGLQARSPLAHRTTAS